MLEFVILGFLMYRSLSGYQIKRFMEESTSNFMDASFGSIYPALNRLEKKGLVTIIEEQTGKKLVKKYSLSEEGKEAFLEWLSIPAEFTPFGYEYLAKVFFYGFIDRDEARTLVEKLAGSIDKKIEELDEVEKRSGDHMGEFPLATLNYGRNMYKAQKEWFMGFVEKLKKQSE